MVIFVDPEYLSQIFTRVRLLGMACDHGTRRITAGRDAGPLALALSLSLSLSLARALSLSLPLSTLHFQLRSLTPAHGLVSKAHRLFCHSTQGSRIKKKKKLTWKSVSPLPVIRRASLVPPPVAESIPRLECGRT